MPLEPKRRQRVDLSGGFLHTVLAEHAMAGVDGGTDDVVAEGLGDSYERDGGGVALGALRRRGNAAAHGLERLSNVRVARHCYLIVSSRPFAAAALVPVGASFRYSWSGAFASAIFPEL